MGQKEFALSRALVGDGRKKAILYRFFNVFTTFFNSTAAGVLL